jgi:hypothetical protein
MLRPLRSLGLLAALMACEGTSTLPPQDARAELPPEPPPPPFTPPVARFRRLTQSQYTHTIHDLFGASVLVPRSLEPDTAHEGSTAIGASETSLSARGAEQYQDAAYAIAEQVLRDPMRRAAVVACTPNAPDDAVCAERFVRSTARRVWRRDVSDAEVMALVGVATRAGSTLMDAHRGYEYALAAMLQAPDFLYRTEVGTVDAMRPRERRVTGYELASRLSFFLWDSTPDDALLDAASTGSLDTPTGLAASVDRMLASPKARQGLRAFVTDWLQLARLDGLSKDAMIFPSFSADLGASAREEVLRNVDFHVFDRDLDLRDLLTTRETFVNRRLAAIYGVQFTVREATPTEFVRVTLPASQPRRGLLGTVAFLALQAHPVSTSPTLRGRFVREQLLCYQIPMPPVNVNTAIPEPSPTLRTLRQRLTRHMAETSCRSCHAAMDPVGLAYENFDGIGRFRHTDNGAALDTSGDLDGVAYRDAAELAAALRESPLLSRCIVERLYRHAWGHVETPMQREETERLEARFVASGHRLRALLREIATGDAFRRALAPMATGDGGAP